jgi:DNA (cytosine-5)-methyltransferase 1
MAKQTITVGSLFAGIGGIELGLERAEHERYQFKTAWQVECDPYAQKILAKHWPDCGRWDDVRTFPPHPAEDWRVDCIVGGFPCQDVSLAKQNAKGINGERSGLWKEYERVLGVLRPLFVIVENTPGLLVRGINRVLSGLAALRFDCEWSIVSACAMGAPHTRERLFIVGHSQEVAARSDDRRREPTATKERRLSFAGIRSCTPRPSWASEPDMARVAYGVSCAMDRLGCLGNAVVPQVAQWIGERILESIDQ